MYIAAFVVPMNNEVKFFSGRNSKLLAENISKLWIKTSDSSVIDFQMENLNIIQ